MSNERIFVIREQRISDLIVVEHGSECITISIFDGDKHVALMVTPEQAEAIASELIGRVATLRGKL